MVAGAKQSERTVGAVVRARPGLRWSTWFLVLALPASALLLLVQPRGANFDATAHVVRLDEVARGKIATPLDADGRAMVRLEPCLAALTADLEEHQLEGFAGGQVGDVFRGMSCGTPRTVDIGNSALNTPVTYLFALPGWWLGRPLGVDRALAGAVVTQLVLYLAVAWAAIRLAPRGQPFLLAIGLLPVSMRTAATISSDAELIAMTLLAVALLLRLREPTASGSDPPRVFGLAVTRRIALTVLAALLVAIPLAKTPYVALALLALLVPRDLLGTTRRWWTYVAVVLGSTALTVGAWSVLVSSRIHFLTPPVGIDSELQREWLLRNPGDFLVAVGHSVTHPLFRSWTLPGTLWVLPAEAGYRSVPGLAVLVGVVALVVALVVDARRSRTRVRHVGAWLASGLVVFVIAVTILVMYVGEALAVTVVAPRWIWWMEGRFFVPLLVLLAVPLAAFTTAHRVGSAGRLLVVGLSGGLLVAYVAVATALFL